MSHYSPEVRLTIAQRVAEMLGLPHMACRRRRCRRKGGCWYHFPTSKQPCCLNNLNAGQRAIFEELRTDTEHVASHWTTLMLPHGTASVTKEVRELAIEIVHNLVAKVDRGRYAEWRRKRAAELAPRPAKPVPVPAPVPDMDWPDVHFTKVEAVEAPEPLIRVL